MSRSTKGTLRPYIPVVAVQHGFLAKTLDLLESAIKEIQNKNASGLSFEVLYRNAYNLVLHKNGDKLYSRLIEVLSSHLKTVAQRINNTVEDNFLSVLNQCWEDHTIAMKMIRDILMYMDRVFVDSKNKEKNSVANAPAGYDYQQKRDQCRLEVYDLGLSIFRDEIVKNPRIQSNLLRIILNMIRRERDGEIIDRIAIRTALSMLNEVGIHSRVVYMEDFEVPFLAESENFYQIESQKLISGSSASEYLKKAEERSREEIARVSYYLDPLTEPLIRKVVDKELIANHMTTIIEMENSGLVYMLENDKLEDLSRMYSLFSRTETGLALMAKHLDKYLREIGKNLVLPEEETKGEASSSSSSSSSASTSASTSNSTSTSASTTTSTSTSTETDTSAPSRTAAAVAQAQASPNVKDVNRYMQAIFDLRDKFGVILQKAAKGDKNFRSTINSAFEYFVNLHTKFPEYLSLFIDDVLKRSQKDTNEEEVESILEKSIVIFRYLQEKDVFERYYKQHLAKRLLSQKSASIDAERFMISKLKTECGYQYTTKLEGMFKDMNVSQDSMEKFKSFLESSDVQLNGIDFNVRVLTMGYWPSSPTASKVILPDELKRACDVFQSFYNKHHSGRRLYWQLNLGSADIKANFSGKRHELTVPTYQMIVLLAFNEPKHGEIISYQDLLQQTDIPPNELKRALQSLSCGKYKILLKEPKSKDISDDDTFQFNAKFTSQLHRIKIQTVVAKETDAERTETRVKVDDDRKHQIEAAIVRIMKARKLLDHNVLILEVINQLKSRFSPTPSAIKARIESLIEREFLERSAENRRVYRYLA